MRSLLFAGFLLPIVFAACSTASLSTPPAPSAPDASAPEAPNGDADVADTSAPPDVASHPDASEAGVDKSAPCVATFGQAIGSVGFARFDGTVVAILAPGNRTCPAPNSTHVVVELKFSGAVYRMVIDVDDTAAKGTIHARTITHPSIGGPWQDGWHAVPLDYVKDLAQSSATFSSSATADAVASITEALDLGAHVSVFATAQGENDSAHLVHRNAANKDGAIVIDPDGPAPKWLIFAFADQVF
jgi:hypothetical protein